MFNKVDKITKITSLLYEFSMTQLDAVYSALLEFHYGGDNYERKSDKDGRGA